jgi:hypothetical protein
MKHRFFSLLAIILCIHYLSFSQVKDTSDEQIIMSFLNTVSAPHYISRLGDFHDFFESNSIEIEGGLRHDYAINNPGKELSWDDINSKSLAIDKFLADTAVKRLIILKNKNNYSWTIFSSYKIGSSSTIYVIGINHSGGSFQIQMTNWPESTPSGICDILGATGVSIYFQCSNPDL